MREFLEAQYALTVLRWDEPDGEGGALFEGLCAGRLIRADSLALLISQAQDLHRAPLILTARPPALTLPPGEGRREAA